METPVSYEDIRKRFHVPARKGARVLVHGQPGTVTTVRGLTLRVRLDGMTWSRPYLPDELHWLPDQAPEPAGEGASDR
ncbi:polysaccharide deacetylase [Acidovorax cavernicola]|uniref:Polysaccharide deacetylase n=1 Tax=Acidovorax cavernicola TaxID=1675792 RepID=A0A9X8CYJ2_9BURK|nr:polysaccharide deacetylase [Acidovorax cavernicola]RIX72455.1 polysaccharide deacetylase [Acidovorax cavernicola]